MACSNPGLGRPLQKGKATHFSILAWRILDCIVHGSQRVGLNWVTCTFTFPGSTSSKEPACQCRRYERCGFDSWLGKIPWRRAWQPVPVFLPGESDGQKSLVGYSPRGHKQSGTMKRLSTHIHLRTDSTTIVRITKAIVFPLKEALFYTFLKYSEINWF